MKQISFKFEFRGAGYDRKIENKNELYNEPPSHFITTELTGPGNKIFSLEYKI